MANQPIMFACLGKVIRASYDSLNHDSLVDELYMKL